MAGGARFGGPAYRVAATAACAFDVHGAVCKRVTNCSALVRSAPAARATEAECSPRRQHLPEASTICAHHHDHHTFHCMPERNNKCATHATPSRFPLDPGPLNVAPNHMRHNLPQNSLRLFRRNTDLHRHSHKYMTTPNFQRSRCSYVSKLQLILSTQLIKHIW